MSFFCRINYFPSVSWQSKSRNSLRAASIAHFPGVCVARQLFSIKNTHVIFDKLTYLYFIADPQKCLEVPEMEIRQKIKETQVVAQGCQIRVCLWSKNLILDHENGGADEVRSVIGHSMTKKSSCMSKACFAHQLHISWCEGSTTGIKPKLVTRHIFAFLLSFC